MWGKIYGKGTGKKITTMMRNKRRNDIGHLSNVQRHCYANNSDFLRWLVRVALQKVRNVHQKKMTR